MPGSRHFPNIGSSGALALSHSFDGGDHGPNIPFFKPIALVVEDDEMQREMVAMLLEESEIGVIQCESGEAALRVLEKMGGCVSMMFTDINLAGEIDGVELPISSDSFPDMRVIVTSGAGVDRRLPDGATFMPKPWLALDVLREAERVHSRH